MSDVSSSLRFRLRDLTRPLHEAVDHTFSTYRIGEPVGYAVFLRAHAAALFALEAWLDASRAEALLPDWPERRRGAALSADLRALAAPLPEPLAWQPVEEGAAGVWGTLYVLEGSRLGARHLARQVPQSLPTAYLRHGEGEPLWPRFVQRLESAQPAPAAEAMGRAAEAAFGLFLQAGRRHAPAAVQA